MGLACSGVVPGSLRRRPHRDGGLDLPLGPEGMEGHCFQPWGWRGGCRPTAALTLSGPIPPGCKATEGQRQALL